MRLILSFGILIFFIHVLNAQTKLSSKDQLLWNNAVTLADRGAYEEVIPEVLKITQKYPTYIPAFELLAKAYIFTQQFQKAINAADICIQNTQPAPLKILALKADALQELKKYSESKEIWLSIQSSPDLPAYFQKKCSTKIPQLQFIEQAIAHPVPFVPIHAGNKVNTPDFELYPLQSPDGQTLYFTRMDGRQEDLFSAVKINGNWDSIVPLSINTLQNEGAYTFSSDGQWLFITACNRQDGLGGCDIFYSRKAANGWLPLSNAGNLINSQDWESQPSISADGRFLFFSSNKEGGKGGKDIWVSALGADKRWLAPHNLGSVVNTPFDEETPFIHADGKSLYFSSNGHVGMGEKDLFVSRLDSNGQWSKPVNLGYPINTDKDDNGLTVALNGTTAFMSSDRPGGAGRLDIYQFDLPENVRSEPVTYVKGYVSDIKTGKFLQEKYSIALYETGRLVTEGFTDAKGEFLACLPLGKSYALTLNKAGYLPFSLHFEPEFADSVKPYKVNIVLEPVDTGFSTVLKNVLFEYNSAILLTGAFYELDNVVQILQKYPSLKVEIGGHTDNAGGDAFNLQLSTKRAEAVVQYLVSKGISPDRLIAKGYGETLPVADNATDEGRSQNRRTTLKVLAK